LKDDELTQKILRKCVDGSLLGRVLNNRLNVSQKLQEAERTV